MGSTSPIGITGEVAEYEAVAALKLEPARVRQTGYDALDAEGRDHWDYGVLVLMDENFKPYGIWRAAKEAIRAAMGQSRRLDLPVKTFQKLAEQVWPSSTATPTAADSN